MSQKEQLIRGYQIIVVGFVFIVIGLVIIILWQQGSIHIQLQPLHVPGFENPFA